MYGKTCLCCYVSQTSSTSLSSSSPSSSLSSLSLSLPLSLSVSLSLSLSCVVSVWSGPQSAADAVHCKAALVPAHIMTCWPLSPSSNCVLVTHMFPDISHSVCSWCQQVLVCSGLQSNSQCLLQGCTAGCTQHDCLVNVSPLADGLLVGMLMQ